MIPALQDKINQFQSDSDLAHQIVNGDATTVVETGGGPVRSFAKAIADIAAQGVIISGTGAPSNSIGVPGQFYIDTEGQVFYGPKGETAWPEGFSLVGDVTPAALQAMQEAINHAAAAAAAAVSATDAAGSADSAAQAAHASAANAAQSASDAALALSLFPTHIDGGHITSVPATTYQFFGIDGGTQ
jgi:hypothetical protein